MTKRTDIHRPSVIVPADYAYVGCKPNVQFDSDFEFILYERKRIAEHMARTGGKWASHEHGGTCHVCGVWANGTVVWYHEPSNTYIQTGETCAEKMDYSADDAEEFNLFRSSLTHAWKAQAGKNKAATTLTEAGLEQCWVIYSEKEYDIRKGYKWEECTMCDIVGKLVKYGHVSDKQTNFLRVLVNKIETRQERMEIWAAEAEAADPVPVTDKRILCEGTILSLKEQDTPYGWTTKMLVKATGGYKLWGTLPSDLAASVGDQVAFMARVQVSDRDPKFGFYSRPTMARVTMPSPEPELA